MVQERSQTVHAERVSSEAELPAAVRFRRSRVGEGLAGDDPKGFHPGGNLELAGRRAGPPREILNKSLADPTKTAI